MVGILMLLGVYFAVAVGLYYKASIYDCANMTKNKAFEAPMWWVILLLVNFSKSLYNKENRKIFKIFIKKPYATLLICFLSRSMNLIEEPGEDSNQKAFQKTNDMVLDKLGLAA